MKVLALLAALALPASACEPKVVRIQLFGDSTQVGVIVGETLAVGPAEMLQATMDRRFGKGAVRVIQRGSAGTTSGNLLKGQDKVNKPWPQSTDADITVINHGINDQAQRIPIETFKANLRAIAPTVYETPNPMWRSDLVSESHVHAIREVAKGKPLADVHAYVMSLPNWRRYLPDGVHPNAELYALIVENVLAPTVAPLVAGMRCAVH